MSSDTPTDGRCNAKTRDGGYCQNYPVTGSDRCRMHGGTAPTGEDSPAYKHGAYSEHLTSDLTEQEEDALEGIVDAFEDPEDAKELIKHQAAEAYLKYKRAGDERFLREYRQLVDTFNLAPNADQVELEADVDTNAGLGEDTEAALREALRRRRGDNA